MDINLLSFKEGQWVYRNADQLALVIECAALLDWDIYPFDRWLFDSRNWSMYTRRRQDLIALRTELALAYGKAGDPLARELLILGYCMSAWKHTRALERRDSPEVRAMEMANARAKALHKTLTLSGSNRKAPQSRSQDAGTRSHRVAVAFAH